MNSLVNTLRPVLSWDLSSSRNKVVLLCIFGLLTVSFSFFLQAQGSYVNDEETYLLMARNFADSGGLGIWNGYRETPSAELILQHTLAHDGRLVAHYPYLSAVLAFPLYRLFGNQGLLLLNALAYTAAVALCFHLARSFFKDTALALNACLILVFATYSWEYSQAIWPHAVSMLFVTAAACLSAGALLAPRGRRAMGFALAAGLVAGFGSGVRLDAVFMLPALAIPFLFLRPWLPGYLLAMALGAVPGLAVLAATNYAKFGVVTPFAYTSQSVGGAVNPLSYLPVAILGLAVLGGAWVLSRPRGSAQRSTKPWVVVAGLAALGVAVYLTPPLWSLVVRMADGTYQLLVDLRIRDLDHGHGGLGRGPGGGLVYAGGVKKALLQSCPYLVVLAVPLVLALRDPAQRLALGALILVPAAFFAPYAFFAWDGGLGLNLRYFVPILPFTSILAALAWREVTRDLPAGHLHPAVAAAATTAIVYAAIVRLGPMLQDSPLTIAQQETLYLTVPLVLALAGLALIVGRYLRPGAIRGSALPAVLAAAFAWSGLVAFTYDYPIPYGYRTSQAELSGTLERTIETDSLVFSNIGARYFSSFSADRRVRVARPNRDDFADFRRLAAFHLDRDRAVYTWLTAAQEAELRDRGLLEGLATTPLHENRWGWLRRLRVQAPAQSE